MKEEAEVGINQVAGSDTDRPKTPLLLVLNRLNNLEALGRSLELFGVKDELPEVEALGRMVFREADAIYDILEEYEDAGKVH